MIYYFGLEGKTALVTGNSKGIGLAISNRLVEGSLKQCLVISRSTGYDLMTGEGLLKLFEKVTDPHIVICNLGGMGTAPYEDMEDTMKKNFFINAKIVNYYLPNMLKRKWGRVIFISSIYGKEKGNNAVFVAAKAAQIAYAKSMAGKYEGVTFNVVCPGYIDVGKPFLDNPPIVGKPEDVANLVTFLCSNQASHINGAVITVDGGESSSF